MCERVDLEEWNDFETSTGAEKCGRLSIIYLYNKNIETSTSRISWRLHMHQMHIHYAKHFHSTIDLRGNHALIPFYTFRSIRTCVEWIQAFKMWFQLNDPLIWDEFILQNLNFRYHNK